MRILINFLFFAFIITSLPAQKNDNQIYWQQGKKLSWGDFQSPIPPNAPNAAITNTTIGFNMGYGSKNFIYALQCIFNKNKSWGRIKNDLILAHEQSHFDICEWHTRKLHQAIKNYTFNAATVSKDLNKLFEKYTTEMNEMQAQYDEETNFSRNKKMQQQWNEKIGKEIEALAVYANYPRDIIR
jgi:Bacterial protein of unknown function (DUF922)